MFQFCFNDCIPNDGTNHDLILFLGNTLKKYNKVGTKFPLDIDGVVTHKEPNSIILNQNNVSLADCIIKLDRSLIRIGFSVFFKKYPIENNFLVSDAAINSDHYIQINGVNHNAFHPKIVADNGGILFSLALHNDIKQNTLNITDGSNNVDTVNNLYGDALNTGYICDLIQNANNAKLGNYEKLLAIIGNNVVGDRFKKGFQQASKKVQDAIISHFQAAIDRKGMTKFCSDGSLIKDVTPEKEIAIKVCELRIFDPVAYRVYFFENGDKVYLALAEQKPAVRVQDNQIKNACSIIKQLLLLEN